MSNRKRLRRRALPSGRRPMRAQQRMPFPFAGTTPNCRRCCCHAPRRHSASRSEPSGGAGACGRPRPLRSLGRHGGVRRWWRRPARWFPAAATEWCCCGIWTPQSPSPHSGVVRHPGWSRRRVPVWRCRSAGHRVIELLGRIRWSSVRARPVRSRAIRPSGSERCCRRTARDETGHRVPPKRPAWCDGRGIRLGLPCGGTLRPAASRQATGGTPWVGAGGRSGG